MNSKIKKNITYEEDKDISKYGLDDTNRDIYEVEFFDVSVDIMIGNVSDLHKDRNVGFVPVFMVNNADDIEKIGIIEFRWKRYLKGKLASDDSDDKTQVAYEKLNFDYLSVHSYITKEYLENFLSKSEETPRDAEESEETTIDSSSIQEEIEENVISTVSNSSMESESSSSIDEEEQFIDDVEEIISGIFEEDKDASLNMEILETKEKSLALQEAYNNGENWVQKFFRNNHYNIIDNEGGGDCFFATMRDALKCAGKDISVRQLRAIVANAADEEWFEQYTKLYREIKGERRRIKTRMKSLRSENKRYNRS